ncbi:MAG: hypothetical protein IPJ88_16540 [Myxococcales bacterium]|nr:MAG: hypothetical protein IPJ88_16540 [Myxococcales bacterium]
MISSKVMALMKGLEISETELCSELVKQGVASSLTVSIKQGKIILSGCFSEDEEQTLILESRGVFFAPRGAKEVVFRVLGKNEKQNREIDRVVSELALAIAKKLWGSFIDFGAKGLRPPVSRDGDMFRVDLRDIPVVRSKASEPWRSMLDLIRLQDLVTEPGKLVLRLSPIKSL